MSLSKMMLGGVLALGVVALSSTSASAQFPPVGGSFGGQYIAPSGGIVTKQGFTNPFNGATTINKQYFNPYTGVQANKQIYIPPQPVFSNPAFGGLPPQLIQPLPPPVVFVPQPLIRPVPVFTPNFGTANLTIQRPGFGINIGIGRIFP
jgi:hypothetical protein